MAPRILLVDDDDMVLHALSAMVEFRLKGITIDTAESAEAALGRIRHIDYDAVVSDIKMPGMDGFQLMEEVLKIRSSTPTLLVTGHGDHDMGVKALKAGAYAFIQKPIDRDYFIAWLTRAIELRRLSRAVEEQNQMLERTVQERTAELERTNQELKTALGQQRDKEEALRASEARFRAIVETTPECVKLVAFDGTLLHMSPSGLRMVEAERAEMVVGKSVYELIAPEDREAFRAFNERICRGEKDSLQFDIVGLMGTRRHMETNAAPLRNPDGAIAHLAVTRDVTERRRAEQLETSQKHVLELIAHDASLSTVFEALVRMLEEQSQSGMLASILLLDDDGLHLRYGAAPNLPEAYNRAIDGVAIGPKVGSCGTAAYRKQAVYVTDIANDSLWADYVDLALAHNLRACWSTPMFSSTGRLLGTLAMYYPEVREPNEDDLRLVDVATHIAAIAIERRAAEEALRASEAKLVAELADTKLLQNISAQLASEEKVEGLCEQILEAAVEIMRSDYGSMQMLYPERGAAGELYLLASHGFTSEAVKFWQWVRADSQCSCGMALRTRKRAIIPNVEHCEFMSGTDDQVAYLQAGMRAAQSTPLLSRSGKMVGMLSTHWRKPHQPSERHLHLLDILARQAADLIERKQQAEEALRNSHAELQTHAEELSRFNRVAVGRELRMIELKREVNALCERLGESARYPLEFE